MLIKTIEWKDGHVSLIDQTKLPHEIKYVECSKPEELAQAIKDMVIRGAPAIGVAAAMGLALAAYNSRARSRLELLKELRRVEAMFKGTRPTAVNLFWALNKVMRLAESFKGRVDKLAGLVVEAALAMAEEDLEVNRAIGRAGSKLIDDGDTVLTHCK